jgi:membrane associated rhomboid family serine protease
MRLAANRELFMERPAPPILNAPGILKWLAAAFILIHVVRAILPPGVDAWVVRAFAFDSSLYTMPHQHDIETFAMIAGPVTHILLHGDGIMHLAINTGLMLAFGAPLARRTGALWFAGFFLLSGIAGAFGWFVLQPYSPGFLVGASGAVSGAIGGFVRLGMQKRPARGGPMSRRDQRLAVPFALAWLGLNVFVGVFGGSIFGIDARVAWEAHLAGFVFGFLAINFFDGRRANPRLPDSIHGIFPDRE